MAAAFWHGVDRRARCAAPFAVTLFLCILGVVPWPLPGAGTVAPVPALIGVHYWTVHRPELMPPAAIFGLGMLQDVLGGAPFGLHALVLLAVHGVVLSQRRHFVRRPFIVDWWGFMMVGAGAAAFAWVVASLYFGTPIWPKPVIAQYFLNLCAYPVLAWIFARTETLVPQEV